MRWFGRGVLASGVCALTAMGCGHGQSAQQETSATPVAELSPTQEPAMQSSERLPVAGHDVVLQPKGTYQTPQGSYQQPQGEYFAPQGIYGERGRIMSQGKILKQNEYGTYVRPKGTVRQPEGVTAQPEGTFFKPFGSTQVSNERQPVAGHDRPQSSFFVRDANGRNWEIRDPALIRRVEQKLSDQGCDPGNVDGVADAEFGRALTRCQDKLGVQPTGVVDQATARALGIDWSTFRQPIQRFQQQQGMQPSSSSSGATGNIGPVGAGASGAAAGGNASGDVGTHVGPVGVGVGGNAGKSGVGADVSGHVGSWGAQTGASVGKDQPRKPGE